MSSLSLCGQTSSPEHHAHASVGHGGWSVGEGTAWGIWPSSENWHLYYRLRQSYGDYRLLEETPGHLFLKHESEDLASFLQLAILNGWGRYLLAEADYVNVFFSHDERNGPQEYLRTLRDSIVNGRLEGFSTDRLMRFLPLHWTAAAERLLWRFFTMLRRLR